MDLPLWYGTAHMDKGFGMYICRGEILSSKVEEFVTHFVVISNDQASFSSAKCVM